MTRGGRAPALDDVAVEAGDAQLGEAHAELLLDALGAAAEVADARRAARRTAARDRRGRAAVVAAQRHAGAWKTSGRWQSGQIWT